MTQFPLRRRRDSAHVSDEDPGTSPNASMNLRSSVSAMFERIEEILEAAERVAEDTRQTADAEARVHLERRRREAELLVSDQLARTRKLVRTLRAQLRDLADEAEAIEREFEHAVASRPDLAVRPADFVRGAESEPPARAPVGYPGTARRPEPDRDPGGISRDALRQAVLARGVELAVAGQSRDRIENSLRSEFRLEDVSSLVDEILARR